MIDSIFVALSGMLGHERGLNVISNNVSNMNTPGFRGSTVSFADVFIGTTPNGLSNGLVRQRGLGGGLDASRTQVDFRAGERQPTGQELDLLLKGEGFFILQDEDGEIRYSRAGNFAFNADDELVVRDQKIKVMTRTAGGQLVPVTLKELRSSAAKATGEVLFGDILSPSDPEHTIQSLDVFDQQGVKHTVRITFARDTTTPPTGTNTIRWQVKIFEGDAEIGSTSFDFVGTVPLGSPANVLLGLKNTKPLAVDFAFGTVSGSDLGANVQSSLTVRKQDGFGTGTITGRTFDDRGVLKITYSNGQTADGPKLALAQISDQNGLVEVGNSLFAYRGSQAVILREAGEDLQVESRSLERSNVNLTEEFSELILMQRGYQASSQVLSTANDMLQQLFDLRGGR